MLDGAHLSLADVIAASAAYLAFVAVLFAGSLLLPGPVHEGVRRSDGSRQKYKLNGLALFSAALLLAVAAELLGWSLDVVVRFLPALAVAANLFAVAAALALWRPAARPGGRMASYLMGNLRDPTLLGVDLKLFSYRPSLIGLMLVNLSVGAAEIAGRGHLSLAMALYQLLFLIYVANYFHFERGMLFTW